MPLSLEDQVQQLGAKIQALEVELGKRNEETINANCKANLWEEKLNDITRKYMEEQELKLSITKDMTRQYKMMQHDLIGRLTMKEKKIEELMDEIQKLKTQHDNELQNKDVALHDATTKKTLSEGKLNEFCGKFLTMLSRIYDNLVQQIDVNLCSDKDGTARVKKRVGDLTMMHMKIDQ
jgi:hypothetical protein